METTQLLINPELSTSQKNNEEKQVQESSKVAIKTTIRALLLNKGMSQGKLGQEIGIVKSYISEIVNSKIEPTNFQKIRIAAVLGVDSRVIWP